MYLGVFEEISDGSFPLLYIRMYIKGNDPSEMLVLIRYVSRLTR